MPFQSVRGSPAGKKPNAVGVPPTALKVGICFGAEGGIRTLAPVSRSTPLAGEPLIATWVLLHVYTSNRNISSAGGEKWRREWDSNPRLLRVTGFQDQLLKPLGHLSKSFLTQRYLTSYHLQFDLSRGFAKILERLPAAGNLQYTHIK